MNNIYLDMNILIDYINYYKKKEFENEELVKRINFLIKKLDTTIVYSPAHVEEVAVIIRKSKDEEDAIKYINQNLKIISKVTNNQESLPTDDGRGIVEYEEDPITCFKRVTDNYNYTTIKAENLEKEKVKKWKSINLNVKDINEICSNEIFRNGEIINAFREFLNEEGVSYLNCDYKLMKYNYQYLEAFFEFAFDFLDFIGYKNDKKVLKKEKYRSRMHDITHSIYATNSEYFITNDGNLRDKVSAIYSLLGIKTKVIVKNEFLNLAY